MLNNLFEESAEVYIRQLLIDDSSHPVIGENITHKCHMKLKNNYDNELPLRTKLKEFDWIFVITENM